MQLFFSYVGKKKMYANIYFVLVHLFNIQNKCTFLIEEDKFFFLYFLNYFLF